MMSAIDELIASASKAAEDHLDGEAGLDFSPLISLAIDLLTDWIASCMKDRNSQSIADELSGGGWRVRYLTRRAVRQAGRDLGVPIRWRERCACEAGILSQCTASRIGEALDDIEGVSNLLMV